MERVFTSGKTGRNTMESTKTGSGKDMGCTTLRMGPSMMAVGLMGSKKEKVPFYKATMK